MLSFTDFLVEVLDIKARIKKKATMRKNKSKLKAGRKRAEKRIASPEKLKMRARKAARKALERKLLKGKTRADLSLSQRVELDKKLDSKKALIDKMAKKLLPQIKKDELEKKRGSSSPTNEAYSPDIIKREYLALSKKSKKELIDIWKKNSTLSGTPTFTDKDQAISAILRAKYGDKSVANAFDLDE